MIIYLCIKFQSNTPILSKDIARKPKVLRTGRTDVRVDGGDTICLPPPLIENGGGITTSILRWFNSETLNQRWIDVDSTFCARGVSSLETICIGQQPYLGEKLIKLLAFCRLFNVLWVLSSEKMRTLRSFCTQSIHVDIFVYCTHWVHMYDVLI